MTSAWVETEGSPVPLGVSHIEADDAYNFSLYSKHASQVTLLLYRETEFVQPWRSFRLDYRTHKSGRIWHCRLTARELDGAAYYAYSLDGPEDVAQGHRFDRNKVLLDPCARAVFFPPAFSRNAACSAGSNAGRAPLGVISPGSPRFDWTGDRQPRHTHDTVIYELHVRGFTQRANSGVVSSRRGKYAGVADKIPYLQDLGVTAVELLPVFQFDPQEGNYWGYMPLSVFALHHAYGMRNALGEQIDEFRDLVKAFHNADIEVILDVVYNHTTEGNENGPTYSFRGIDNTTYYLLDEERHRYRNDSGTGNVVHAANRYVRGFVLESLRYWAREMHIDGFRFDLASLFTRASDGTINLDDPPIITAIQSDPDLSRLRLIAEAWDISSYQLGRSFPGASWLQWNDRFRDQVRVAVRGDHGSEYWLRQRLYGSADLFPDTLEDAYHAFQSVNFVTCHDGFCLHDLVAYNQKHNEANGHHNEDGPRENLSWNCGWEGQEGAPGEVVLLRKRQAKNFLCLLFLANGTPMLMAGDEFMNTQQGNNNPYNQDNETTWLDWDRLTANADLFRFCKLMIAFRKAHPSLGRSRHWRDDVRWYDCDGVSHAAGSGPFAFHLKGFSQGDRDIYTMINQSPKNVIFSFPTSHTWLKAIDTALPSPDDIRESGAEKPIDSDVYEVQGRSIAVFLAKGKA